jgi:Amt family ammonium transporter
MSDASYPHCEVIQEQRSRLTPMEVGGGPNQLFMQLIDVGVLFTWAFGVMYIWMKLSNLIVPMRPPIEIELQGLDATQMGALAYPDFAPVEET